MRAAAEIRVFPEPAQPNSLSFPHGFQLGSIDSAKSADLDSFLKPGQFHECQHYFEAAFRDVIILGRWLSDEDRHRIEREVKMQVEVEEGDAADDEKRQEQIKEKLRLLRMKEDAFKKTSQGTRQADIEADHVAREQGSGNRRKENKTKHLRLMFAEFHPQEVETKKTVGRMLLGPCGEAMNELYLKSWFFASSCLFLWWVGFVVSVLSIFGRLSPEWTLASLLMLPAAINGYLLMNVSVLYHLLMCFDLYYCVYNLISFLISFAIYNGHTHENIGYISTFAICYGLSTVWVYLTDAQPSASRRFTSIIVIGSGIVAYIMLLLGLYLHWMTLSKDEILKLPHVAISASSQCSFSLANIVLFSFRNLATAILFPDSMVLGMD